MQFFSAKFWRRQRNHIGLLIGVKSWLDHMIRRNGAIIPKKDLEIYDLITSSCPPTVDYLRQVGVPAELHRLGFEPEVLPYLEDREAKYDVTFLGNFAEEVHDDRIRWLEKLFWPSTPS